MNVRTLQQWLVGGMAVAALSLVMGCGSSQKTTQEDTYTYGYNTYGYTENGTYPYDDRYYQDHRYDTYYDYGYYPYPYDGTYYRRTYAPTDSYSQFGGDYYHAK